MAINITGPCDDQAVLHHEMGLTPEAEIRAAVRELLVDHGLTWDEFIELGEGDQLADLDSDLDFAFRALVPSLRDPIVAA